MQKQKVHLLFFLICSLVSYGQNSEIELPEDYSIKIPNFTENPFDAVLLHRKHKTVQLGPGNYFIPKHYGTIHFSINEASKLGNHIIIKGLEHDFYEEVTLKNNFLVERNYFYENQLIGKTIINHPDSLVVSTAYKVPPAKKRIDSTFFTKVHYKKNIRTDFKAYGIETYNQLKNIQTNYSYNGHLNWITDYNKKETQFFNQKGMLIGRTFTKDKIQYSESYKNGELATRSHQIGSNKRILEIFKNGKLKFKEIWISIPDCDWEVSVYDSSGKFISKRKEERECLEVPSNNEQQITFAK